MNNWVEWCSVSWWSFFPCNAAQMYCQLCHLLFHRFGEWFIWIALPIVVGFIMKIRISGSTAPFDVKSLSFLAPPQKGCHLIVIIFEYIIFSYEYLVIASTLALCIGTYCYAIAMIRELKRILYSINAKANDNQSKELQTLFSEFNYTHGTVEQLSILTIFL